MEKIYRTTRAYKLFLKLPSILEKIVAAILMVGVIYGCIRLASHVFQFDGTLQDYTDNCMILAFNVVLVIEFIRMLVKHSTNTVVEVLIFAIARGLVIGHEVPVYVLIRIASIAILLACRKYLFKKFDFEEEE